ncbi:MAG: hypothetical protein ACK417_06760 [Bacteroidia bacterium]
MICILSLHQLQAQPPPALKQAEAAFEAGLFPLALYEYNRMAFELLPQVDVHLHMQIGRCHLAQTNYQTAAAFFDQAYFATEIDSIKMEAALYKTRALIAEQQFALALSELLSLKHGDLNKQQEWSYHFYRALCHYQMGQFEDARNEWLFCTTDSVALEQAFLPAKKFHRPNSTSAMLMSALLPGSGQLYAGEYREATNSFLINGFFIFYGIRVASRLSPLDALIGVAPWFQRYHAGGYNKASLLAYNKMLENRKAYLSEIFHIIENSPSL